MSASSVRWVPLLALVTILLRSGPAHCEAMPPAEVAFAEGRRALTAGDLARARAHFEASYRLEPAVGTLLNLAVCEEQLGLLLSAQSRLEEAKRRAQPGDKRLASIEERRARVAARIPSVTLRLRRADAGVQVAIDGRSVAASSLGRPLQLDPGTHEVTCLRAGQRVCTERVAVSEGRATEVWLDVPPARTARPSVKIPIAARKVATRSAPQKTYGYVAGGVGVSALALAIAGAVQVLHYERVMSRHCDASGCDDQGLDAAASGRTWAHVGTIGTAVAVLGLGTAGWFLIAKPTSPSSAQVTAGARF